MPTCYLATSQLATSLPQPASMTQTHHGTIAGLSATEMGRILSARLAVQGGLLVQRGY